MTTVLLNHKQRKETSYEDQVHRTEGSGQLERAPLLIRVNAFEVSPKYGERPV
jgi:hypothetical protein